MLFAHSLACSADCYVNFYRHNNDSKDHVSRFTITICSGKPGSYDSGIGDDVPLAQQSTPPSAADSHSSSLLDVQSTTTVKPTSASAWFGTSTHGVVLLDHAGQSRSLDLAKSPVAASSTVCVVAAGDDRAHRHWNVYAKVAEQIVGRRRAAVVCATV